MRFLPLRIASIIAVAVFAGHAAFAERANLLINLTGLNPDSDWFFDAKIIAGADRLDRPAELTQQPQNMRVNRLNSGVQVQMNDVYFDGTDAVSLISLVAYQQDPDGTRRIELYFPVHLFEGRVANQRNITIDAINMRGTTNSSLAARQSFPFRNADDEPVTISDANLVAALNAVREIARRPDLNDTVWSEIFLSIQQNSSLIAQRNDVLRKIVDILNEYKEVNETDAFVRFYMVFLRKMVLEELGERIRLNDSALINDYFRDEVSTMATANPQVAYAEMNDMLAAFESAKSYERCIRVAHAFQRGITQSLAADPDWWLAQPRRTLATEIYNGLIAGTRCAQLSYAEKVGSGTQADVVGGAAYTVTQMPFGLEYATSFVDLVDAFQESDVLSMEREEITKFDFFYTLETNRALGL